MAKKKDTGPSSADLNAVRQVLGVGPEVPDSDLKILMSTKKGQDEIKHIASQGHEGVGSEIGSFLSGGVHALEEGRGTKAIEKLFGNKPAPPEAKKPVQKAKPLPDPSQAAATVQQSPYEQLANALASEYLGQVNQLMPLTSGSALPGLTSQVTNQAAAAVPGAGGWLQQQAGAEQKAAQGAGLPQAMNAVGEAQAQGALPYAGAIANTGVANTQYLEAAPWQQILTELASETAYKAASSQGAAAFGATPQNTPAFLQQIFKNLGLAGTATAPGGGLSAPGTAAKGGAGSTSSATSNSPSQTG